jgi:hypothetical protein
MPTFTDASLVAAGTGVLLWAMLATEAPSRRRTWAGMAAFAAIELATFVRYTNIVVLGCAVVTVIATWRLPAVRLPARTVCAWFASAIAFGIGVAVFDDLIYGSPLRSGYQPGEVTFSLSAIGTNLRIMPRHLLQGMPVLVPALVALVWLIGRGLSQRAATGERATSARRDVWVAVALAGPWVALWGLYAAYTWTADPTSVSVQVIRFYVPAIGSMSLLGAWLLTRLTDRPWLRAATATVAICALFCLGVWSFHAMYAAFGVPLNG